MKQKKILVVKFGGLGDVILSLDAMYSIYKKFGKNISLLTEEPFDKLLKKSQWFKEIFTIKRSKFYLYDIYQIKKKIDPEFFSNVFDLQTSNRSSYYLKIFKNLDCDTNGIGKYSKTKHLNANRDNMHTIERQKDQLGFSKVKFIRKPNLSWFYKKSNRFNFFGQYALVVPGGSEKRLNKRIPLELFFEIVSLLINKNIKPILIGAQDDFQVCKKIEEKYPKVQNLCLKTSFFDIASLATNSIFSIGNDTGPTHIISRANKKTIVLFTKNSNPNLCSPVGKLTEILTFDNSNNFFKKIVLDKTMKAISR
ncbi:MAG: lipopolysaccharide heptosyltransferase family protein [Pelagibacteraceae bacterium TMED124]|nr:hypothetical protein [Rickettsiales bacterium]RPG16512.1 MAG: lipopolysaccharide heptosyltransferase family protein [Pelagibacteraceae bacterium TMED124]